MPTALLLALGLSMDAVAVSISSGLCRPGERFWRLLRMRSDTIFFHASTVGICGQGIMFIGAGRGRGTYIAKTALEAGTPWWPLDRSREMSVYEGPKN